MDTKELCPICGEGHVTDHVDQFESEYKGEKAWLPLHYQLCDVCTSDFAGTKESKLNKRAVMAFRKSVDGLLTGDEICALRAKYKLTQTQAAKLFGGGPVAFSKYENDDVAHSEAMDTLLRLVRRSETAFWELVDEKGMTAELVPAKTIEKIAMPTPTIGVVQTNVLSMADFRAAAPSSSPKTSYTYPVDNSGAKKWK
jgi:HTH-type transcriptional regulator / antitoxin MqsA